MPNLLIRATTEQKIEERDFAVAVVVVVDVFSVAAVAIVVVVVARRKLNGDRWTRHSAEGFEAVLGP